MSPQSEEKNIYFFHAHIEPPVPMRSIFSMVCVHVSQKPMETLAKPKGNTGNPLRYLRTDSGKYQHHRSQQLQTECPELENIVYSVAWQLSSQHLPPEILMRL